MLRLTTTTTTLPDSLLNSSSSSSSSWFPYNEQWRDFSFWMKRRVSSIAVRRGGEKSLSLSLLVVEIILSLSYLSYLSLLWLWLYIICSGTRWNRTAHTTAFFGFGCCCCRRMSSLVVKCLIVLLYILSAGLPPLAIPDDDFDGDS